MASTAELLIRVMADTSQANSAMSGLTGNLGKSLGIGGAAVGAAALTDTATQWQTAMARIGVAYNDVNFAPGTAKFEEVQTFLRNESTQVATSASDLSTIYQTAARYAPTSISQAEEFTDTVARLMQVSHDLSDPTETSQDLAKFLRIFGDTNAAGVGAAIAQLSTLHTQGEAPVMEMAQNLALAGTQFGLTEAQVLGLSNVLVDAGIRSSTGGTAISRMFLELGQAASAAGNGVDENSKKIRDAMQKVDDVQNQLTRAESPAKSTSDDINFREEEIKAQIKASRAGGPAVDADAMRQQLRNLSQEDVRMQPALLQAQHQQQLADQATTVSRLKQSLADAQQALATAQEPATAAKGINIAEASKLAGMSTSDFADFFKSDAFGAFTAMIGGLKDLPKSDQASELGKLGIKNVRDVQNLEALAAKFDTIGPNVSAAQQQITTPTTLGSESGIMLDTTAAKLKDTADALQDAASIIGEPLRKVLDEGLTNALDVVRTAGFDPLVNATSDLVSGFGDLDKVLAVSAGLQLAGGLGSFAGGAGGLLGMFGKGASATAADASIASAGAIAPVASAAADGGAGITGIGTAGAGVSAIGALSSVLVAQTMTEIGERLADIGIAHGMPHRDAESTDPDFRLRNVPQAIGNLVQYGNVVINNPVDIEQHAEAVKADVIATLTGAWNAAKQSAPSTGALGGSFAH